MKMIDVLITGNIKFKILIMMINSQMKMIYYPFKIVKNILIKKTNLMTIVIINYLQFHKWEQILNDPIIKITLIIQLLLINLLILQ